MNRNHNDLPAPPRLLFWLAIGLFVVIVLLVTGAVIFYTGGQRLGALIPYAIFIAVLLPILAIGAGLVFRKRLPRFFVPILLLVLVVLFVAGAFISIYGYRELLPPRYQEEVVSYMPFMRSFMRPTPAGGVVPTVASTSAISLDELLAVPIGNETTEPTSAVILAEETEAATVAPTVTPTQVVTATAPPIIETAEPTAVSAAPTEAQVAVSEAVVNVSNVANRPADAHLGVLTYERQQWNNCGPTNITMALSAFGWGEDQEFAASYVRPNTEDKNVSPHELVAFVNEQSFVKAIWRIGGDMNIVKDLIAANFPVVIETGGPFAEGYDWIGHYQTVVGYDDNQRVVYLYDSYLGAGANGAGIIESYDVFDAHWQDFNRTFIVLYDPSQEAVVAQILGSRATPTGAAEHALEVARQEARANPSDPAPWFNLGTAYLKLGMPSEAANAYDQSRRLGLPFRFIWYQFGVFEAYYNTERYSDVQSLAQSVIQDSGGNVEEAYYWLGRAQEALGNPQEAVRAYNRALVVNPLFADARAALDTLNA